MTLTQEQIDKTFKRFVREYIKTKPMDLTKVEIKSAVTAAEQWTVDNETSFNNALPVPFRTNATISEKAFLLAYVLSVKYLGG